jgi:hypothetical protein
MAQREPPVMYSRRSYVALVDLAQNPSQLAMIRASAGHADVVPGVRSEEEAKASLEQISAANRKYSSSEHVSAAPELQRGRIVRHVPSGRKVTVIRASAGRKNGERLHEVVDAKTGKKFLARESNLKPVH